MSHAAGPRPPGHEEGGEREPASGGGLQDGASKRLDEQDQVHEDEPVHPQGSGPGGNEASGNEDGDTEPLAEDEANALVESLVPVEDPAVARARLAGGEEAIPMLTEVVQVPRYEAAELPKTLAEVDWGDLSQRVRENVLERLLRRSDALLDAQLQATLEPVLERAAESVAQEMHSALDRMIRDIVARAVTEELTRLHAEIARRNRQNRTK